MNLRICRQVFLLMLTSVFGSTIHAQQINLADYKKTKTKAIVESILKYSPIVDGHNDLFAWYFGCDYKKLPKCPQDIEDYPLDTIQRGHTDIPRWRKGGVGGVLLNVFADSLATFLDAYDLLYRIEKKYDKDLSVVTSSSEMQKAIHGGKIALLPMLEGSVRLENKLSYLRTFYKLGLRCVTFTYYTSDLGDGSDDKPIHNGISDLGIQMVKEMNDLGIIIDMSHISANAMSNILDVTTAPVIFSHSNVRTICNVNRNVPDSILLRLKENGGMIMIDMVPDHTSNKFAQWMNTGDSLYYSTKKLYPNDKQFLKETITQWERKNPAPEVSISEVADHFDYVKNLIGVDHIGISGDYDGTEYTIKGLEDVSCFPNLLIELVWRGWTESEIKKITKDNFLRVFKNVEDGAKK